MKKIVIEYKNIFKRIESKKITNSDKKRIIELQKEIDKLTKERKKQRHGYVSDNDKDKTKHIILFGIHTHPNKDMSKKGVNEIDTNNADNFLKAPIYAIDYLSVTYGYDRKRIGGSKNPRALFGYKPQSGIDNYNHPNFNIVTHAIKLKYNVK